VAAGALVPYFVVHAYLDDDGTVVLYNITF
jgi:hypothetical protein